MLFSMVLAFGLAVPAADAAPTHSFTTSTKAFGAALPVALAEGAWEVDRANRTAELTVEVTALDGTETRYTADWTTAVVTVPPRGATVSWSLFAAYERTTPGNSHIRLLHRHHLVGYGWTNWMPLTATLSSEMLVTGRVRGEGRLPFPGFRVPWRLQSQFRVEGFHTGTDDLRLTMSFALAGR